MRFPSVEKCCDKVYEIKILKKKYFICLKSVVVRKDFLVLKKVFHLLRFPSVEKCCHPKATRMCGWSIFQREPTDQRQLCTGPTHKMHKILRIHKFHKIHKKVSLEENTYIAHQLTCTNTAKCVLTYFDISPLLNTEKFSSRTCSKILIAFVRTKWVARWWVVLVYLAWLRELLNCFEHCSRVDSAVCLNCVLEMLDIQWRRLLVSYSCSSILCLGNIPFLQIFYNIPQIFKYSLDDPTVWVTVSGQF